MKLNSLLIDGTKSCYVWLHPGCLFLSQMSSQILNVVFKVFHRSNNLPLSGKKMSEFYLVGEKFRHLEAFSSLLPDQNFKFVIFPRPNLQFSHFHPTKLLLKWIGLLHSLEKRSCNPTFKALISVIWVQKCGLNFLLEYSFWVKVSARDKRIV